MNENMTLEKMNHEHDSDPNFYHIPRKNAQLKKNRRRFGPMLFQHLVDTLKTDFWESRSIELTVEVFL
jgi:hypothetical protein